MIVNKFLFEKNSDNANKISLIRNFIRKELYFNLAFFAYFNYHYADFIFHVKIDWNQP